MLNGETQDTIQFFRNGARVAQCTGDPSKASPDPCVSKRETIDDGDIKVTILTSSASSWNFGSVTSGTTLYDSFKGFYSPVDNRRTANVAKAGSAIPVKFSLGGDKGLQIFYKDYPQSGKIPSDPDAPLDSIEQTLSAGSSSLSYVAASDRYTYVWKTDKAWDGQTRQLVLRLSDGSEYKANFKFTK